VPLLGCAAQVVSVYVPLLASAQNQNPLPNRKASFAYMENTRTVIKNNFSESQA
jgi:hypothetical protein